MKEKKKTSNSNNTILRVEKGSLEDKWLSAQSNKTFALKLLIRNAYHQFGNIDLQNVAIDNFLQSPMIDLVKQSRKENLKEEQASSDNSNAEKIASSFNHEHKDKADTTKYQQDNDELAKVRPVSSRIMDHQSCYANSGRRSKQGISKRRTDSILCRCRKHKKEASH